MNISDNKIVDFVTYYKTEGVLVVNDSKRTTDRFHILSDYQRNTNDDNPFE